MLKDLIAKNRSYRGYDSSVRIYRETLLDLVELARLSASSVNKQPLKFHIAWEKEEVEKIQKWTYWAKGLPELNLPYPGEEPTAFIVICHDTSIMPSETAYLRDIGIVAQSMLLGAVEKGLGGIMIGNFNKAEVAKIIGLPDTILPNLVIAIGKPIEKVVLTEVGEDGSTAYFRDASGRTHYVPKRKLEDLLI